MTAAVLQLRDYERLRPVDSEPRGPAEVVILPVVLVERVIASMTKPPRAVRRSLLGDA